MATLGEGFVEAQLHTQRWPCAAAILSAALYVCVKDPRWLYSATDKFFIVGRLFRSVIMHTLLLSIKQLKKHTVSCRETGKLACVKL